ncbi:hypothetical protein P168DRAFT_289402 [Aspergillus campestris IBT 28561]|uniref:Uncharacterized protein n=1 Tax=Aspergillus campestris (strain IBT 28561) TaxID=1392248 RepID=A0A2I1D831_ASPC2|nr:uncharacterized protein P168DRAFT_289402 [Aspergillus campestris IBT 28561]PKY06007.1 hypothetical protein P168DRAFT_289402 [Aspergillus campestris IBT 28561]
MVYPNKRGRPGFDSLSGSSFCRFNTIPLVLDRLFFTFLFNLFFKKKIYVGVLHLRAIIMFHIGNSQNGCLFFAVSLLFDKTIRLTRSNYI